MENTGNIPSAVGSARDGHTLLEVNDLQVHFMLDEGTVRAVDGVSFKMNGGRVLGVVGESGCGKSVLARSIMRIVRPPGQTVGGEIIYYRPSRNGGTSDAIDLNQLASNGPEIREIRGSEITLVFQEPMVSFSPVHTIAQQIMEGILLHQDVTKREARNRAIEMLRRVGIPNPESRIDEYPFNLSGGMRQRCMIAMALSGSPKLLIADEPTTALDVTTQAQILDLMSELQQEFGMAMMLITHNLGVVAQMAEEVIVMYLGKIVEHTDTETLFKEPKHPYTVELLKSIPRLRRRRQTDRLTAIAGTVPPPYVRPKGCPFHPRCPKFMPGVCDELEPQLTDIGGRHAVSCLLYSDEAKNVSAGVADG